MTIAMCYVSPEGVVLGADSTSSLMTDPGVFHFFNHNQKIFELGRGSTIGVLTWGLGSIGTMSHRTMLAKLDVTVREAGLNTIAAVAEKWREQFSELYTANKEINDLWSSVSAIHAKLSYNPDADPPPSDMRTMDEHNTYYRTIDQLTVGFCFGGYDEADRIPTASFVVFTPLAPNPSPQPIPILSYGHWGVPNMIKRLIAGYDEELVASIIMSKKWTGSPQDLLEILEKRRLGHAILPIRDAIDFVHTCIYSTIKAMKFSNQAQVCGGPIEIAVITTDRRFRWVKHKPWNAAILEGEHRDIRSDRETGRDGS